MPFSINPDLIENNDVEIQTVDGELALFHKPSGNTLIVDEDTTVSEKLQSPLRDDVDLDGNDLLSGGSGEFAALEAEEAYAEFVNRDEPSSVPNVDWFVEEVYLSKLHTSAAHAWRFDEGEGETMLDLLNDAHAGIDSADWIEGEWVGGYAIETDGDGDAPSTGNNLDQQVNTGDSGMIAVTVSVPEVPGEEYAMAHSATGEDKRVQISAETGSWRFGLAEDYQWGYANDDIIPGTKYRIALRWDNGEGTAFINGEEVASGPYEEPIGTTVDPWTFGHDGDGRDMNAQIDHPVVYYEPLSDAAIEQDFQMRPWVRESDDGDSPTDFDSGGGVYIQ